MNYYEYVCYEYFLNTCAKNICYVFNKQYFFVKISTTTILIIYIFMYHRNLKYLFPSLLLSIHTHFRWKWRLRDLTYGYGLWKFFPTSYHSLEVISKHWVYNLYYRLYFSLYYIQLLNNYDDLRSHALLSYFSICIII